MSLVEGEANVAFLKKRFKALSAHPLFEGMTFSDDPEQLKEWIPLVMEGRTSNEPIAATKSDAGTDVNFGALTRILFDHLERQDVEINYKHAVQDIQRTPEGNWEVKVHDIEHNRIEYHTAKFIFIGAGGGSLPLLQKPAFRSPNILEGFR